MATSSVLQGGLTSLLARVPSQGKGSRCVVRMAAARQSWCPGLTIPKHLDGSLPGDNGYDPLNLGADPQALKWYRQSELVHSRVAMMGITGMLIPSVLTKFGVLNTPEWYDAGKVAIENSFAPFNTLLMVELFLCGWVESKRWMDFKNPKSQGEDGSFLGIEAALEGTGENGYPGGAFNFLDIGSDSESLMKDLKDKELANGRLSMFAFVGFVAQYYATGKGPVDNLLDHIANPYGVNFATNGVSLPFL